MKSVAINNKKMAMGKYVGILTVLLFVSSVVLRISGIYTSITTISTFTLGLFSFFAICSRKEKRSELFVSTLLVGDCAYLLSLFFMVGKTVMESIH